MRYVLVNAGNGFCGCNEDYLLEVRDEANDDEIYTTIMETYSYESGAAGIDPDDEEFEEYPYEDYIADNTGWEEITEEEFIRLRDEEDYEVRQSANALYFFRPRTRKQAGFCDFVHFA